MASKNPSLLIQQQDEGHHHLHSMSRLSLCTQDHDHGSVEPPMSIENFDADEELSDRDPRKENLLGRGFPSSDSEKEPGCYSLPATPPRRRRRTVSAKLLVSKDYESENESGTARIRVRRRRSAVKDRWPPPSQFSGGACLASSAGESDHGGVMVITRPKGGRRSLCMGMEEVKACNDLGFELEHEHIMPRLSVNTGGALDFDTSSGNSSPIANWRISSPGDDPRDVKARLKVWAQAVAIASTSRKGLDLF